MRVAVCFPGCHRRAGVERVMFECVNFLAARGHETHAFASDWDLPGLHPEVIRHQVGASSRFAALMVPAFVRESFRKVLALPERPEVVAGFGAASAPDSVVWMQSVHAAWMEISRRTRGPVGRWKQRLNPFHPVILRLERRLLAGRQYRKIVALTEQVRDDVENFYGVPREDIVVIPNGFSPQEFSLAGAAEKRGPMRAQLGYGADDKVVIFVGNEAERKGFRPLLQAIALLRDPKVHLLAVGVLRRKPFLKEIRSLGLESRVRFAGVTSEVADYFAAADVFALPTQYEAWGLTVIEAMACGIPALTSRLAGAAIVVHEGVTGALLDDPTNAADIAAKLAALLRGEHAPAAEIAASVDGYRWSELLLRFESVLAASRQPLRPMRIAQLTDTKAFAGTERHILDLATALHAQGVCTEVACPSDGLLAERARAAGLTVFPVEKRGTLDLPAIYALWRRLRAGELDIIHSHNGRTALLAAVAATLAGRGRTVTTQHFLHPARTLRRGWSAWLAAKLHRWVIQQAARVIAISGPVREAILQRQEAEPEAVKTVWNGIADPAATALRSVAEVRAEFGIPAGAPLIVSAARLEPEKRVEILIEAMGAVLAEVPEAYCLIAGEGAQRAALEHQIAAANLGWQVHLAGFRSDVLSLLQAADIFALPSEAEPFGLAIVEAMALCKPVIATRAGGPLEIVEEGVSGMLVAPGDAGALRASLLSLLRDPALRESLGQNARRRFETHFTAPRMAEAMSQVYRTVMIPSVP